MKKIFLLMLLFVSVYTKIQGQTVICTYNAQGSCTSRVYANGVQNAKSTKKLATGNYPIKVSVSPSAMFCDNITISTVGASNSLAYVLANASGQVVLKGSFVSEGVTLATSSLPCGIYLLKVSGENYEHSYKLTKR